MRKHKDSRVNVQIGGRYATYSSKVDQKTRKKALWKLVPMLVFTLNAIQHTFRAPIL